GTHYAAAQSQVSGGFPAPVGGPETDEIADQGERPQPDRQGHQHRMDGMAGNGYACRHNASEGERRNRWMEQRSFPLSPPGPTFRSRRNGEIVRNPPIAGARL